MTSRHNAREKKYKNTKRKEANKVLKVIVLAIFSSHKYDICKNFLVTDSKFRCTAAGKTYFIKGKSPCDSCKVIYLITCSNCKESYEGSATNFKQRFGIHKSHVKTNKVRCGTLRHFNNKCCSPNNKMLI